MNRRATSLSYVGLALVTRLLAVVTFAMCGTLAPVTVHAQTCNTVLQGHFDWATSQPDGPGTYYLDFAIESNQDGLNATFAEGILKPKFSLPGSLFTGKGMRYFSKKRWDLSAGSDEEVPQPGQYPFNPGAADSVTVVLNATTSRATLYLSNVTYDFDLVCDHPGVLRGVGNAQGPWNLATPMFVISLRRGGTASPSVPR
jgi:hypothetical protein